MPKTVTPSLSARRAWIEIPAGCWRDARRAVALRKESVDRNLVGVGCLTMIGGSLSARRAWIEIARIVFVLLVNGSLSARRAWIEIIHTAREGSDNEGRSPQGERG